MNRSEHRLASMCRVYDVSPEGYYSWRRRGESLRQQEDAELFEVIHHIFKKHEGCYGSPKITREMHKCGFAIGQKRVARLMREHGLKAKKARIYKNRPGTYRFVRKCPNRILDINLTAPNQLWVGDVTYIKLSNGTWRYLAVIMDRYSRRIVGWSLSDKRDMNLSLAALERATRNRGHHQDLIFHSDRGVEYLAYRYRKRLKHYGITQSMNRVKEMNDNAFIESFFLHFKTERLKGRAVHSEEELRAIVCKYMRYYNYERSHSSIGYISPDEFECRILN